MIDEVQKHKHIRIKFWENTLLFISDSCLSFLIPHKLWHKKKKLIRLLNEGRKRIEKELDIVKILKSLRDIKILMKNSLMTPEIKYQILRKYFLLFLMPTLLQNREMHQS